MSTTSGLPNGCKGALPCGAPRMRALRGKMLRTCECPGCFSPLRSGQGTASLVPLCGDPHSVKGVTFAVTPYLLLSCEHPANAGVRFFAAGVGKRQDHIACKNVNEYTMFRILRTGKTRKGSGAESALPGNRVEKYSRRLHLS